MPIRPVQLRFSKGEIDRAGDTLRAFFADGLRQGPEIDAAVEAIQRIQEDLKSGQGPREVLAWLELVSQAMALEEKGQNVSLDLRDRIHEARQQAVRYF